MKILLKLNKNKITVNGTERQIDVAPFLQNDRTFVPIRALAEAFGFSVDWEEKTETITITDKPTRYFESIEKCAYDWCMCYNNLSIGLHKELGSTIYKCDKGYFYTDPNIGESNNVVVSTNGARDRVAIIHSHASTGNGTQKADKVSSGDITASKTYKCDNFVATPCGSLLVYRYDKGKIEEISRNIPFDRRSFGRLINTWKYPQVANTDDIFKAYGTANIKVSVEADFYNKLFNEHRIFPLFD